MKVVFRSGLSLRSMLTKVKDTLALEKKSKVVYQVPCSCGEIYIGETLRRLKTRHSSLNRDGGLELPGCWMATLRKAIPQLPVTPLDVASGDSA